MYFRFLLLATCLLPTLVFAQSSPAPASSLAADVVDLQAVTVSGVQPGPGLWKVSRGDHVLWILATLDPLPDKMQWQTAEVERSIAGSQVVLGVPGLKVDAKVGFFGKLFLIPSILKARKNPDGATLQQLVSADDYARWLQLKAKYIGRDHGIERWRPIFAALELYRKAIKRSDLDSRATITDKVRELARAHDVPIQSTHYRVRVDDPRAAIKTFTRSGPDDLACFHQAVTGMERELPLIRARANAWATGDIAALRAWPPDVARQTCMAAITEAGFARQLGLNDLPEHVRHAWMEAAEKTLAANRQSFAMLPLDNLVGPHSVVPALRAAGYSVVEPDQDAPADPVATHPAPVSTTSAGVR